MFADIAIDVPLDTLFTYRIPRELEGVVKRGTRVLVSFGKKKAVGFCLEVKNDFVPTEKVKVREIKDILAADAEPLLSDAYLKWLEFAADHYVCPPGQVFSQAVPAAYFETEDFGATKTRRAKEFGILRSIDGEKAELTRSQRWVSDEISGHSGGFFPALVHGVTGSGKTEVYIDVIEKTLNTGKSALYLVPEIGLTPQTLARLARHFEGNLAVTHSGLTANQRLATWQKALNPDPVVTIGTRSALFAPFRNLGLLVVDEEHDSSYKQEDRFRYNARDLAVARARFEGVPIVLGSATPSLETYHQAKTGKYRYFELAERIGSVAMPKIDIIDFAREREQTKLPLHLSQNIVRVLGETLAAKKQAILFVGQRGYAQNAFCTECRAIQTCRNCSVGLKFHAHVKKLKCHYCDFEIDFDETCLSCAKKALTLIGSGIQSVEEEVRANFPQAKTVRVDSDAFPSPQKLDAVLADFAAGGIDIIVGTQMMSKGHDFAGVGFVGIVGIDANLGLPDFRAAEKSFQTVVQVAGRAGRHGERGRVLVQSFMPEHTSLAFAKTHDFAAFASAELAQRETLHYPPFSRLVQIRFSSNSEGELDGFLRDWRRGFTILSARLAEKGVLTLGPSEMPIAKLRGRYRHHLILKIPRQTKVRDVVRYVLDSAERTAPKKVQIQVDVDPAGLL